MFSKTGTAEVATDPMPPNVSDAFVILKPQDQWPAGVATKADVIERVEKAARGQLGQLYEVSQPIELRFNELISGVRGDVAIKLYGDDLDKMSQTANEMVRVLQAIPGASRSEEHTSELQSLMRISYAVFCLKKKKKKQKQLQSRHQYKTEEKEEKHRSLHDINTQLYITDIETEQEYNHTKHN